MVRKRNPIEITAPTPAAPPSETARPTSGPHALAPRVPTIGLALGGGGARGLAHILMLEAFDELGLKPKVISGTSIGAIVGAAYASGIPAATLRAHTRDILSQKFALAREVFAQRPIKRLFGLFPGMSALLDAQALLEIIMPKGLAADFDDLHIPLKVVASDFYEQEPQVFSKGPLLPAVAASMALPAIFQPIIVEGKALIDGGLTNPLPYDILFGEADIIVAIDVSGAPVPDPRRNYPSAVEALFSSAFLFERTIVREKLKSQQPDILVPSGTSQFQVLDILKVDEILAAAEPAKAKLKAQLERVLSVETLATHTPPPAHEGSSAADAATSLKAPPRRRGLLGGRRNRKAET